MTLHSRNIEKDLSHCHKLRFSNPYVFATQCRRPKIFQTMHSGRSNNLSLKYIKELENFCLWQRLNSFLLIFFLIRLSSKTFDSFNIDYIVFHLKWIKKFFIFYFFIFCLFILWKKRKENDNVEKTQSLKAEHF